MNARICFGSSIMISVSDCICFFWFIWLDIQVLTQMLSEHESKLNANLKKKRKLMKLFKIRPAIGLLNVAVEMSSQF